MGGHRTAKTIATLAFASAGVVGCASSTSGNDDAKSGGSAGLAQAGAGLGGGGTAAQGASGDAGAGGHGGSTGGAGGASNQGGSAGSGDAAGEGGADAVGGGSGSSGAGTSAGGMAAGSAGDAAGSSAAGSAGAAAGSSAAGSAGTSGSGNVNCSGTFFEHRTVLDIGEGAELSSPTLSADETELLFALGGVGFARSTRASKLDIFEAFEPIDELDEACLPSDSRTIDLSGDGLRAYLVCYTTTAGELRIATRSTRDAPFVLDPESYGTVGISPAIATGDLTLYTSAFAVGEDPPLVFERSTTSAPFGEGQPVPGIEAPFSTPDPSADGLWLFGTSMMGVAVASRASVNDPFTNVEIVVDRHLSESWISPTISEDCRTLYAALRASERMTLEEFTR